MTKSFTNFIGMFWLFLSSCSKPAVTPAVKPSPSVQVTAPENADKKTAEAHQGPDCKAEPNKYKHRAGKVVQKNTDTGRRQRSDAGRAKVSKRPVTK